MRELAELAGVNPNTMQRALSELEEAGLVYTQRTSGRYVTEDRERLSALRRELALEKLRVFLEEMRGLGYERGAVAALLEQEETT